MNYHPSRVGSFKKGGICEYHGDCQMDYVSGIFNKVMWPDKKSINLLLLLLLLSLLNYVCICVFPAYMPINHLHVVPTIARSGYWIPCDCS